MHASAFTALRNYAECALATEGGHLAIGQGGATLYFDRGWLSGCIPDAIKAEAVDAGLPVIDSRGLPFEAVWNWRCADRWSRSGSRRASRAFTRSPTHRSPSWRKPTGRRARRC